jgi:hypothetical protein
MLSGTNLQFTHHVALYVADQKLCQRDSTDSAY